MEINSGSYFLLVGSSCGKLAICLYGQQGAKLFGLFVVSPEPFYKIGFFEKRAQILGDGAKETITVVVLAHVGWHVSVLC